MCRTVEYLPQETISQTSPGFKPTKDKIVEGGATRGTTALVYYSIHSSLYTGTVLYTVYKGARVQGQLV
jgi:hypothetical protein